MSRGGEGQQKTGQTHFNGEKAVAEEEPLLVRKTDDPFGH